MQRRPISKPKSTPDNRKRTILVVAFLLAILMCTAAWAMWSREDPQMTKVREMAAAMDGQWNRDQFRKMREETDKLTEAQRDQFRDEMRQRWEEREAKEMKEFFQMSPQEQIAALDKRIDQ